jgi:predicted Zn-dependent protease
VARALAYSAHARLGVLQRNEEIVRRPPFSNQLTYPEDQAKLARETARLEAEVRAPGYLAAARAEVAAAIAADPRNPDLAKRAEEMALDAGDVAGALAAAHRATELLPYDLALNGEEASLLSQLGRFPEAEARLQEAARRERDREKLVPMRGALEIRRRDFSAAQAVFDDVIVRHPGVAKWRLMRASLARIAGREADAEQELRAILDTEAGDEAALEGLVSLLMARGKSAEAEQVSLASAEAQTRNQLNDLRVARIYEVRGDLARSVRFLEAATRCGPVPTALEVTLARQLHELGRDGESLLHLAQARRLAALEADTENMASIDEVLGRLRAITP